MNLKNTYKVSSNVVAFSVSFLLLAIALVSLMLGYWQMSLEPRLSEAANTHAQLVGHSQAASLATIISSKNPEEMKNNLDKEVDRILLLTEPMTKAKLFKRISIQLDYDVVQALSGSLNFTRGNEHCENCIQVENALYSNSNDELLGIVKFTLNKEIFLKLKNDLEHRLFTEALVVFLLLFFVWFITLNLIIRLNKQKYSRKQIEDALRQNEKKYYRLTNNLNNYFTYRKDTNGEIIHMSDSVEQVIGYSLDDIMINFDKYTTGSESTLANIQKTAFDDEQISYEVEVKAKDGSIHNIELSEITIRDNDNQIIEYEGIAHDITEQKRYEKQLSDSKEQAELANKIKSQFLANMSHEIRTPLNGIIGLGQVLLKSELTSKQRLHLQKINTSSDLLLHLVNEILDFSKVESGQMELDKVNFSIQDVVNNVCELLIDKAIQKNIQLSFFIEPDVPDIMMGDPLRLSQILMNITNNAIKFTEQGKIDIHVDLSMKDEHSYTLLFKIKDTGIGLSPKDISKLFKEFSQVDSSMSRKFGGTGLGLAICKKLAHLMQGRIWVESQPEFGSTFFFTVRLERISTEKNTDFYKSNKEIKSDNTFHSLDDNDFNASQSIESGSSVPKILLAEDNKINQVVALNFLEEVEAEVVVVNNGREALERVQKEHFSLILMDLQMPEMDGFEAMEHIRAIPAYANLPIIAMTAHAMLGDRERCLKKGMNDYLAKPVDMDILIDTVNRWLNINHSDTNTSITDH
ncbi:MAG: response regulator [Gammaproteobacteria bacterium]|nr:response regulator [Gammaproteobacteria bacterium]